MAAFNESALLHSRQLMMLVGAFHLCPAQQDETKLQIQGLKVRSTENMLYIAYAHGGFDCGQYRCHPSLYLIPIKFSAIRAVYEWDGRDGRFLAAFSHAPVASWQPRAAGYEKRIAALIANDGVFDYGAGNLTHVPPAARAAFMQGLQAKSAPEID
jgi:hypothetical protein